MSDLNDDKKVLEGRKNTLKGVDASLRDQIPEKLASKLEEMEVGDMVYRMWAKGQAERQERLERQRLYLSDWDEFLESTADGPFQGASSIHIPMPMWVCKTFHARFLQAALGSDPPFVAKARQGANEERVQCVSDTMRYAINDWMNENQGVEGILDEWIWQWVTVGEGIVKSRWDVKYQRFVDVQKVAKPRAPKVVKSPNGDIVLQPQYGLEEVEKVVTKKCFDGPVVDNKNLEDVVIVGGSDPQNADAVLDRQYMTASEMWTLVDRKIFRKDEVEDVIEGGTNNVSGGLGNEIKQDRATNSGQIMLDSEADLDRYEIVESYLRLDVDGSGINSDVVVWVHLKSRAILRATYLHRINKTGKRPFHQIIFHKRDGNRAPLGLLEMLHPLSVELDAMHNMKIDFGLMATMPFGFYRPTSSLEAETLNIEPGCLIPLDNPQTDVYFPNLGNRTAFGMQEEAALINMVERLTSISDISLGIIGGQGATRTATGTRAIVGEANANLDVYLRRFNRGWKDLLNYLFTQLQQRMPAGLSFRVTGDDGKDYWRVVQDPQYDMMGDYDFELTGNSSNSNRQIQQDTADMVVQVTSNPLDFQLGIISPLERYEALKNMLQSRGVRDYGRFLKKPQASRIYTPEEEANKVLLGIAVPVTPEQDHVGFISYVEHIIDTDELLGQFTQQQTVALAKQMQQHKQMQDSLNQMAAQQKNQMQMQMNMQMGIGQGGGGGQPQLQAPVGGAATGGGDGSGGQGAPG